MGDIYLKASISLLTKSADAHWDRMRRPEAERWSQHIIMTLQATPQQWDADGSVVPTGSAVDVEDIDTSEPLVLQIIRLLVR